jgi:hypothetical protein
MARNARRNALFDVVLETRGLRRLDGGVDWDRTWDPCRAPRTACHLVKSAQKRSSSQVFGGPRMPPERHPGPSRDPLFFMKPRSRSVTIVKETPEDDLHLTLYFSACGMVRRDRAE